MRVPCAIDFIQILWPAGVGRLPPGRGEGKMEVQIYLGQPGHWTAVDFDVETFRKVLKETGSRELAIEAAVTNRSDAKSD